MNKKILKIFRLAGILGFSTFVSGTSYAVHGTCMDYHDQKSCTDGQCHWIEGGLSMCSGENPECSLSFPPCPAGCVEDGIAAYCSAKLCYTYHTQSDCLKEAPGCGWDKKENNGKGKCVNIVQ